MKSILKILLLFSQYFKLAIYGDDTLNFVNFDALPGRWAFISWITALTHNILKLHLMSSIPSLPLPDSLYPSSPPLIAQTQLLHMPMEYKTAWRPRLPFSSSRHWLRFSFWRFLLLPNPPTRLLHWLEATYVHSFADHAPSLAHAPIWYPWLCMYPCYGRYLTWLLISFAPYRLPCCCVAYFCQHVPLAACVHLDVPATDCPCPWTLNLASCWHLAIHLNWYPQLR